MSRLDLSFFSLPLVPFQAFRASIRPDYSLHLNALKAKKDRNHPAIGYDIIIIDRIQLRIEHHDFITLRALRVIFDPNKVRKPAKLVTFTDFFFGPFKSR